MEGVERRKLTENKVYLGVMEAFQPHFEPRLRPMLSPANPRGGFGSSGRLQFTPSEDVLLALGVWAFRWGIKAECYWATTMTEFGGNCCRGRNRRNSATGRRTSETGKATA